MDVKLEEWIKTIIATEHPSKKIIGYYFGIFELESKQYNLYLIGSEEFDKEHDDWACNDDFEPKEKYLSLPQYDNLEWEKVLDNIVTELCEFSKTDIYKSSFFSKAQGVAVGFDDGNLYLIKA